MPKKTTKPGLLHKPTGQARVRIDGHDHFLGEYGSPESREQYDQLICEWLNRQDTSRVKLRVDDLCLLYLVHTEATQSAKELVSIRAVLRWFIKFAGRDRAAGFGSRRFREFRDWLVEQHDSRAGHNGGLSRQYVNKSLGRIRQKFKWAAREELVPVTAWQTLTAVEGLRRGRANAREAEAVLPVADDVVQATIPHLSETICAMVLFQRATGCRPGEVCVLRPIDVDRSGEIWLYRPKSHKTAWRGKERIISIGPRGQAILAPYLLRPAEENCFSPQEAEAKRLAERHEQRQTPIRQGNKPGTNRQSKPKRQPGDCYTTATYGRAISRAVAVANRQREAEGLGPLPKWSPNQLRHTAGTEIRAKYGLEAAQVALGHSQANVPQIYAERDMRLAMEVARQMG